MRADLEPGLVAFPGSCHDPWECFWKDPYQTGPMVGLGRRRLLRMTLWTVLDALCENPLGFAGYGDLPTGPLISLFDGGREGTT